MGQWRQISTGTYRSLTGYVRINFIIQQIKKKFSHGFRPEVLEGNLRAIQRAYEEVVGE